MRHSHKANFRVTQVHQDHEQIIDENKQAEWNVWVHTHAYVSVCHDLHIAANRAQTTFDQCRHMHLHKPCKKSKVNMQTAARKLSKALNDLGTFQTPNYYDDVYYDSIFSFEFALDNGISVMY